MIEIKSKVLGIAVVLIAIVMLASALSPVEACGWRSNKAKVDFVFHIENVVRVDDNVRYWYDTGESGTGTPPVPAPEGVTKEFGKGYQFVLLGDGTYLQIGETKIPLAPEEYSCEYDVCVNYDVEFPVVAELKYFTREKITFNTAEFKGFLKIYAIEDGAFIVTGPNPWDFNAVVSGVCFGYGCINGKAVTLYGDRELLAIFPSTVIENSGTIQFLR